MSKIRNIWEEVNVDLDKVKTTPLDILKEQAKAINKDVEKTNLLATVMSFTFGSNDKIENIKHTMYLFPKNGGDYNYRFIELEGKPDSDYPLTVYAYHSGNINFGECKDENDLYDVLVRVFKDNRLKILFEQLKNIGNTIDSWKNDVE